MAKNNDFYFEYYQKVYNYEIERKEKLNAALSLPTAVCTLIIGFIGYYIQKIFQTDNDIILIFLISGAVAVSIFIVISIYNLIESFYDYDYEYIETPRDLDNYKKELANYYQELKEKNVNEKVLDDIREHIINRFIECTEINTQNNDWKTKKIYIAKKWLTRSLIAVLFCIIPLIILEIDKKIENKEKIHKVQIIEGIDND